jgi:glycosyltransferase involved in cell wall biosynthesis
MTGNNEHRETLDLSVVIPAYHEEQVIFDVVSGVHEVLSEEDLSYEVIVVDDGSEDRTGEEAEKARAKVLTHAYNIGNGAAVKTGIRAAKGKIILMMDGDGQHNPGDIPGMLEKMDTFDMVVGSLTKDSDTDVHRDFGNIFYNLLASYICNRKIKDLTSGFRAFKADIGREFLHLLPNTFSYPTTITLAVARSGYPFTYYPIQVVKRKGQSKINIIRDGLRFFLIIFKVATLFSPLKVFIPASLGLFSLGFGYGLYKVLVLDTRYGPTSAMLMTMSGLVFLIGLVSEQLTQLRFGGITRTPTFEPQE